MSTEYYLLLPFFMASHFARNIYEATKLVLFQSVETFLETAELAVFFGYVFLELDKALFPFCDIRLTLLTTVKLVARSFFFLYQ